MIFQALGLSAEEARNKFGFFLDALEYGTPHTVGSPLVSTASSCC